MKTPGIFLALSLLGVCHGVAQQEEFDPLGEVAESSLPKLVRVQVEFIEVAHETMTELLYGPQESTNDTALRAKLQELIKTDKARMVETQMATARSGQKATSEAVHEFIYPTEYEPPVLPDHEKEGTEAASSFPSNPATPTAFETKSLGSNLEIEPTIGEDEKLVDLRFLPELIYHTGNDTWTEVTEGKDTYRIQMPNFYKMSTNTSVVLITGQYLLAAASSPKDEKGEADLSKKILVFVKADVLTVGR